MTDVSKVPIGLDHPVLSILNNLVLQMISDIKSPGARTYKKRHHFVPLHYLKGFTNDLNDMLYQYDKNGDGIKMLQPKDAAMRKNYYTINKEGYEKDSESIEDFFAAIESNASPVIPKIEAKETLNVEERAFLSIFIAHLFVRVPNYREIVDDNVKHYIQTLTKLTAATPERYRLSLEGARKEYPHAFGDEPLSDQEAEEMRQFALSNKYDIVVNPKYSIVMALKTAYHLSPILYNMNWFYVLANDRWPFLTCDNPVYKFDPRDSERGHGLASESIEVTIPISKSVCLLCTWQKPTDNQYFRAPTSGIKEINRRTVISAQRFVYANRRDNAINRLVRRNVGTSPKAILETVPTEDGGFLTRTRVMPTRPKGKKTR